MPRGASRGWAAVDWYDEPRWYDAVYARGTRREADFLESLVRQHGRVGRRRALEPACGSGRLVAELARRGWRVSGFDASAAMLAHARARLARRGLAAQLVPGRFERMPELGSFELAYCLVSSFKYVLTERAALAHLRAIARALVPGGLYVLGVDLAQYDARSRWVERWRGRSGRARVALEVVGAPPDRGTRNESMRSRLIVRDGATTRRSESHWKFRTYDRDELAALLARCPELEHVATHGYDHDARRPIPFDGERLDTVLVLRRRSERASRISAP